MARGAFILAPSGPVLTADEARFFGEADPFGFILFARHAQSPDQLRALTSDLRASVGWDAPILIDQEGGRVERMTAPHWSTWLPPLDDAARLGPLAVEGFALRYRLIALELRAVGIDTNCAPLGDIARPDTHPILRNRCYGDSAVRVQELARAVARGLMAGGVLPVMKHLPGHGGAVVDSHLSLPRVADRAEYLRDNDFAVFRGLNDLPMAMTAHIVFEDIDELPATQSPTMIDLIRQEIGFDGLLMTDDISMQALAGTVAERGAVALAAGCDIVLHCNGDMDEMQSIAALGNLGELAEKRAKSALATRRAPEETDAAALREKYAALVRRAG